MLTIGLAHYLFLSAALLALGVATMIVRRNAIGILLGVELVLNSAGLNFVALARFNPVFADGQIAALFVIVLAAAEAAVLLAIFLNFRRAHGTVDVDSGATLRG